MASQCKVLQGWGCVVSDGDAAKVIQVCVMAKGLGLVGVGDADDLATISVAELSGARRGTLDAEVRREHACELRLQGVRSYDALIPRH